MKIIIPFLLLTSSLVYAQTETKLFEVYNHKSSSDVRLEAVREGDQVLFKKTEGRDIISSTGEIEEKEEVIEAPKGPQVPDFYLAVSRKNYADIESNITSGIAVDTKLYAGNTALHMASSWNDKTMVDLLLKNNASAHALNAKNELPLHFACGSSSVEIIKTLITAKGIKSPVEEFNKKTKNGRTCMHFIALTSRNVEVAKYVASFKPDFKIKDEQGQNPGHFAAATGNWLILTEWLKTNSLDLEDKDKFDMTVEDYIQSKADVFTKAKLYPYLTAKTKTQIKENLTKSGMGNQIVE
jgi:Ankyrin repeats (3 copies)